MTAWLAWQLSSNGSLVGIDNNLTYVNKLQKRVSNYHNVLILHKNVYDIVELKQNFDLIYVRMLLHHLFAPEEAMIKLIRQLNPNGILVCEEPPTMVRMFAYPKSLALEKMINLVTQCFQLSKIRYTICYEMAKIMEKEKLQIKIQQTFQPLLNKDQRSLYVMIYMILHQNYWNTNS